MAAAGDEATVRGPSKASTTTWTRGRDWLSYALVSFVVLAPMRGLWRAPGPPMEEGFMLVFPEEVLHGAIPNRDFLHLYGPGSVWVLAGAFKVFGTSIWTERSVGLLQQLALIAAVYAMSAALGQASGDGRCRDHRRDHPSPGRPDGDGVGRRGRTRTVGDGRRAPRPPPAGRTARRRCPAVPTGSRGRRRARPHRALGGAHREQRSRLLKGAALGLSPFLVHIALAGPGHAFFGMVLQPVFQLRAGRHLPLPPSWSHFDGFLQRAGELNAQSWPIEWPARPAQLTLWLFALIAVAGFIAVIGWRVRRSGPLSLSTCAVLVMGAYSVGLLPQALQRPDSTHLAWVGAVPFGLLPVALAEVLRARRGSTTRSGGRLLAAALAPSLLLVVIVPHFTFNPYTDVVAQTFDKHREVYVMHNEGRSFYYGRRDAAEAVNAMLPVVDQLAKPGDKLFVGTGDLRKTPYSEAFLYYLLPQTRPGTRYVEMDPGVANRKDSGLADDLAGSDLVILSSIRDDWSEPNASLDVGSDQAVLVLQQQFCMVGSWGKGLFGRGLYELYKRCDAG